MKKEKSGYLLPASTENSAYAVAREAIKTASAERMYLHRPWRLVFAETGKWFLKFLPLALLSFNILLIPLVPCWIIMLYNYFYVYFNKLNNFGISKIKFGIFSAFVIIAELIASHFIRLLAVYVYRTFIY